MQFITYMIIPCAIYLILPIFLGLMRKNARLKEKELNKCEFEMKASKAFGISMVIFTVIWVLIIIFMNICDDISIWINIILWVCELFLVLCCVQSFRQKISVKTSELFYTPIIGKKRVTQIKNIDKVVVCLYSRGVVKYKIYVSDKVFCSFSNNAIGAAVLIDILRENQIPIVDQG